MNIFCPSCFDYQFAEQIAMSTETKIMIFLIRAFGKRYRKRETIFFALFN